MDRASLSQDIQLEQRPLSPLPDIDEEDDGSNETDREQPKVDVETVDLTNLTKMRKAIDDDFTLETTTRLLIRLRSAFNENVTSYLNAIADGVEERAEEARWHKIHQALNQARAHREASNVLRMEEIPRAESKRDAYLEKKKEIQDSLKEKHSQMQHLSREDRRERLHSLDKRAEKLSILSYNKQTAIMKLEKALEDQREGHPDRKLAKLAAAEKAHVAEVQGAKQKFLSLQRQLEQRQKETDEIMAEFSKKDAEVKRLEKAIKETMAQIENCTVAKSKRDVILSSLRANLQRSKWSREKLWLVVVSCMNVVDLANRDRMMLQNEILDEEQFGISLKNDFAKISKANTQLEITLQRMNGRIKELSSKCHKTDKEVTRVRKNKRQEESKLEDLERLLRQRMNDWEFCLARLQTSNRTFLRHTLERKEVEYKILGIKRESLQINSDLSRLFGRYHYLWDIIESKKSMRRNLQIMKQEFRVTQVTCRHRLSVTLTKNNRLEQDLVSVEHRNSEMEKSNWRMQCTKTNKEEMLIQMQTDHQRSVEHMKLLDSQALHCAVGKQDLVRKKHTIKLELQALENKMNGMQKEMSKGIKTEESLGKRINSMRTTVKEGREKLVKKDLLILEIRRQRDLIGSLLTTKIREFDLASKYLDVLEKLLSANRKRYSWHEESLGLLKRMYGKLKKRLDCLQENEIYYNSVKCEFQTQCEKLTKLKAQCRALRDSRTPRIHRWRYLQAVEPSAYSKLERIWALNTNLKMQQNTAKRLRVLLGDREKFLADLQKMCVSREPPERLAAKKEAVQDTLVKQSRKIKVLEKDLKESQHSLVQLDKRNTDIMKKICAQ